MTPSRGLFEDDARLNRRLLGLVVAQPRIVLRRAVGAGMWLAQRLTSTARAAVLTTLCAEVRLSDRAADCVLRRLAYDDELTPEGYRALLNEVTSIARAS